MAELVRQRFLTGPPRPVDNDVEGGRQPWSLGEVLPWLEDKVGEVLLVFEEEYSAGIFRSKLRFAADKPVAQELDGIDGTPLRPLPNQFFFLQADRQQLLLVALELLCLWQPFQ